MNPNYNQNLLAYAKSLRKNMTKEERKLWYDFLSSFPVRFYRQKIIGRYILDFYCPSKKIAIELDGSQHYEDDGIAADKERDEFLASKGIKVFRYSNLEFNRNFEGICLDIQKHIEECVAPEGARKATP